jgi:phage terminase small subunit
MAKSSRRTNAGGLNAKQQRFVDEYLIDLNATQAAIRAGYSPRTAKQQGARLLTDDDIAAAVAAGQNRVAAKAEITAERVLRELARIGFANIEDYLTILPGGEPCVDLSKASREQLAAVQEVTVEDYVEGRGENARDVRRVRFKLHDKRAALVDLGRHLGLFNEKGAGAGAGAPPPDHDAPTQGELEADRAIIAALDASLPGAGVPSVNGSGTVH